MTVKSWKPVKTIPQPNQPGQAQKAPGGRKPWTSLSPQQWQQLRAKFESDPSRPTLAQLARAHNVTISTVCKHARAENWLRHDALAIQAIHRIESDSSALIEQTAQKVTDSLSTQLAKQLQPWLEAEKTKHIKNQIRRSKLALRQLDKHIKPNLELSPKDSSFVAKSAETWDTIARRNLGLTDGTIPSGSLSLSILTNHAAVAIKSE